MKINILLAISTFPVLMSSYAIADSYSFRIPATIDFVIEEDEEEEELVSEYPDRKMCYDILSAGNSNGDGTYSVDPDGDGTDYGETDAYCDMGDGGWTLYDNFSNTLIKTGEWESAYNATGISSVATLEAAGYTKRLTTINSTRYHTESGYMQFYYSGSTAGYIYRNMPDWATEVRAGISHEWYSGSATVSFDGSTETITKYTSFDYYDFSGSGTLQMGESGSSIIWVDSVWVK